MLSNFLLLLISYLIFLLFITFYGLNFEKIKFVTFTDVFKKYCEESPKKMMFLLLKLLLSLDWVSAYYGKVILEITYEKEPEKLLEKKTIYLTRRNLINLLVSFLFFFIALIGDQIYATNYIIPFVLYRCISRTFEIIFAFSKDVIGKKEYREVELVDGFLSEIVDGREIRKEIYKKKRVIIKKSNLNSNNRIKLAIKSYIEILFNYAVVYHLLSLKILGINNYKFLKVILHGDYFSEEIKIWESFYKCIGISTASGIGSSELGLFSTLHSITVIVLVVFAIASYLSND